MKPGLRHVFGLAAASASFLVAVAACIGDDPGPSTGAVRDGSVESSAAALCATYCQAVTQRCKGENEVYATTTAAADVQCAKACPMLPPGSPGDKNVNSVQCRLAEANSSAPVNKASCATAGPYGGGVCGSRCEAFCQIAGKNCTGRPGADYASAENCAAACATYRFDESVGQGTNDQPFSGQDDLNCRMLHLILSLETQDPHCAHGAPVSPVCTSPKDAGKDG